MGKNDTFGTLILIMPLPWRNLMSKPLHGKGIEIFFLKKSDSSEHVYVYHTHSLQVPKEKRGNFNIKNAKYAFSNEIACAGKRRFMFIMKSTGKIRMMDGGIQRQNDDDMKNIQKVKTIWIPLWITHNICHSYDPNTCECDEELSVDLPQFSTLFYPNKREGKTNFFFFLAAVQLWCDANACKTFVKCTHTHGISHCTCMYEIKQS